MSNTAESIRKQASPLTASRVATALPKSWPLALSLSIAAWSGNNYAQTTSTDSDTHSPAAEQRLTADPAPDPDQYASVERRIELGEFVPAVAELESQVESIEDVHHRYHTDLIEPLILLGDALHGTKNYPAALDAYGRAIHISRVSGGLHSPDQLNGVYKEAKVYYSAGQLQQANDREEYAWRVLKKSYGPYSPKLLPGLKHLADWYNKTYNSLSARSLYKRAVRIVEANYDDQHPEMVPALRGLANTYRLEKFPPRYLNNTATEFATVTPANINTREVGTTITLNRFPQGEKALKRVVRIQQAKLAKLEPIIFSAVEVDDGQNDVASPSAETQSELAVADPKALAQARQQLVAALVELGDWYLLFESSRAAMQYYTQAEVINNKLDEGETKLDFTAPALLHFPAPANPRPPKARHRGEAKQGFVELSYTITVRGSTAKLETVNSDPKGLMDYRVRKSMLSSRFRPTFVDGTPVTTSGHSYRHEFNYYPTKPDPQTAPSPDAEPAEDSGDDSVTPASTPAATTTLE